MEIFKLVVDKIDLCYCESKTTNHQSHFHKMYILRFSINSIILKLFEFLKYRFLVSSLF